MADPPENFTAVAVGPDLIRLRWDDIAFEEDYYEIQRAGEFSSGLFETRYIMPPGTLTQLDGDHLVHESEYCYRIRAVVGGVPTPWSATVCATTLEIPDLPDASVPLVTTVQPSTWGALFHTRIQPEGRAADRAELEALGFTILEEELFAGRAELWGYGGLDALNAVLEDSELKIRIRSHFFLMPAGEPLTIDLIRKWADFDDVIAP